MRDAEKRKKKELEEERKKNMENLPQTPAQHCERIINNLQDIHATQDSSYKVMDDMLAKIDLHLATPKSRNHTPQVNLPWVWRLKIQVNSSMPTLLCRL